MNTRTVDLVRDPPMTFDAFVGSIKTHLRDLAAFLWDETPDREAKADRLTKKIRRRCNYLVRVRASQESCLLRLARQEKREAQLAARMNDSLYGGNSSNAYQYAVELEQLRHAITMDRSLLQEREAAYEYHLAGVARLKGRLREMTQHLGGR